MQLSHPLVIALEKCGEILGQIFFVEFGERAHNAEVQRDVAAKALGSQTHLDVAGVHVGMEEAIPEHLGKKQRHTVTGQLFDVHTGTAQALHLVDGHAVHALHHHHFGAAVVPDHLWNQNQVQILHVAAQLGCAGSLAQQIQLVVQVFVKLGHHLAGLESAAIGRQALHPTGHHAHQRQVFFNHRHHVGPQHLDSHLPAIGQHGKVNLGNGGAGNGCALERCKHLVNRTTKCLLNGRHSHLAGKRRHPVLQQRQLIGNICGQQITPGGQHLTEFDKNRPQ